ncbi:hypothetical protein DesLBE_3107 [Desulfitobacterium sp. LBE]|uniref:Uncharacterized protein n=1 Tax=Desulfitobacterium hafniense TaxID=49338 RepID=A0A098AVY9_DESHA|nr:MULTISPECIES: hypothetical protein [Desulfitobacterium]TWH58771.1 hypothetical protein DesLBE_3107 [Desulfitobacterium sp. LBE]CDX00282.1 Hypothetical protein DPCES_0395 [Desulfitobacterium hafniense]
MSSSKNNNVIDFQQYKEKRELQRAIPSAETSLENDFQGKLRLTQEDAEMIIYCMRLGREYFMIEVEETPDEGGQAQRDFETVNSLLDRIQYEVLKLQTEEGYIVGLSILELAFIIDCVEMTRNAVGKGINVFQSEPGDKEDYAKWLDGTFFYLLDVYEKWRFYQGH